MAKQHGEGGELAASKKRREQRNAWPAVEGRGASARPPACLRGCSRHRETFTTHTLNLLTNYPQDHPRIHQIYDARLQFPWRQSGTFCSPLFIPTLLSSVRLHYHSTSIRCGPQHQSRRGEAAPSMEGRKAARVLLASFVLGALAAQAFVGVVEARSSPAEKASQADVKKPDCVPGMDPRTFPGIGGHGGVTPLPSHGGSSGTTPSHGGSSGTSPSHGGSSGTSPSHGGGYGGSPSHGGSGGLPSPSHGGFGTSPSTGGGYGGSPTPSHGGAYGSAPTPDHGGAYGGSPATPSHGAYGGGSPATPSHGGFGNTTPMPSVPVDPHGPSALPGSCDYWRSHPMEIWSAIGGRFPSSSMGHFFSAAGSGGAFGGPNMSIQDALANTRTDGAGALLREGAAALLNSMTRAGFPYTTEQVRDAFAAAAAGGSDGAAAAQAVAFKKANEGRA